MSSGTSSPSSAIAADSSSGLILDGLERLRDEEAHPKIGAPRGDGAGGEPIELLEGTAPL
jgi:hypothetical protein